MFGFVDKLTVRIPEQQFALRVGDSFLVELNIVQESAVGNEEILEAIVVKIKELRAPPGVVKRCLSQARLLRRIFEGSVSFVAIKGVGFEFEIRHNKVQLTVSVIIPEVRTHAGLRPTIPVIAGP